MLLPSYMKGRTSTELKNVNIQYFETIQSFFTRVSQIKEELEAIEENVKGEIVMTTLNGLPKSWDSFIQGICTRKNLIKLSRLWEECTQEESRLVANDDQALTTHAKKDRSKREDHPHISPKIFQKNHRPQRDKSNLRCFTCDEKGHFAKDHPRNKGSPKANKKKRHHAHTTKDDEPTNKKNNRIFSKC